MNYSRGAEGRTRTDTKVALQQFLRLSRLPIPPLRLKQKDKTSTFYQRLKPYGAEAQNWTGDTRIFSPLLYQLSYLGTKIIVAVGNMSVKQLLTCILSSELDILFILYGVKAQVLATILFFIIAFVATAVASVTGFGSATILIPFAGLVVDLK